MDNFWRWNLEQPAGKYQSFDEAQDAYNRLVLEEFLSQSTGTHTNQQEETSDAY